MEEQCKGITKSGQRCKNRRNLVDGYCRVHRDQALSGAVPARPESEAERQTERHVQPSSVPLVEKPHETEAKEPVERHDEQPTEAPKEEPAEQAAAQPREPRPAQSTEPVSESKAEQSTKHEPEPQEERQAETMPATPPSEGHEAPVVECHARECRWIARLLTGILLVTATLVAALLRRRHR
ncbi:MAG: hypothetical protein GF344_12920 [Chitinivibrionales bacterium]|nr:hypothetical protein [Chitinivibrionales bacterium]MBD3357642.1 hypothetical protein [Chitinivibrionales bacterium]